jgi:uncharacterized protein YjbJ (UPF0337 family)
MSTQDKVSNTSETAKGETKEGVGSVTGNESLEAEGDLKQTDDKSRTSSRRN